MHSDLVSQALVHDQLVAPFEGATSMSQRLQTIYELKASEHHSGHGNTRVHHLQSQLHLTLQLSHVDECPQLQHHSH